MRTEQDSGGPVADWIVNSARGIATMEPFTPEVDEIDLDREAAADAVSTSTIAEHAASDPTESLLDLEEAFSHRAELTEICRRIVGDVAIAEDVVQETYLQAIRNQHRLEQRDGIMPWLVTVAKRRSLNELRRRRYSTPVEELPERTTEPELDPVEAVAISDELERVQAVLNTLTPRERELLLNQVYRGMSLTDLAEMENSSAASVRSVLSRARAKIKAAIAETGARIIAPISLAAGWVRRRMGTLQAKVHEATPAIPVGGDRLKELFTAGAVSVALAVGGSVPTTAGVHATPPAAPGVSPAKAALGATEAFVAAAAHALVEAAVAHDGVTGLGDAFATSARNADAAASGSGTGPSADSNSNPTGSLPVDPGTGDDPLSGSDDVSGDDLTGGVPSPPDPANDPIKPPDPGKTVPNDPGGSDVPNEVPNPDPDDLPVGSGLDGVSDLTPASPSADADGLPGPEVPGFPEV